MGILGKDGDFVIPPEYEEVYARQDDKGNFFFMCKTSDGKGYVKDTNNSVLFEYDGSNGVLPAGNRCFVAVDSIKTPAYTDCFLKKENGFSLCSMNAYRLRENWRL